MVFPIKQLIAICQYIKLNRPIFKSKNVSSLHEHIINFVRRNAVQLHPPSHKFVKTMKLPKTQSNKLSLYLHLCSRSMYKFPSRRKPNYDPCLEGHLWRILLWNQPAVSIFKLSFPLYLSIT